MANLLLKRIKDWATSITTFRTGDVIPVDGPSGTAKMTKDNLLARTAENTLGSIHSLSRAETDGYLVVDNATNGVGKVHSTYFAADSKLYFKPWLERAEFLHTEKTRFDSGTGMVADSRRLSSGLAYCEPGDVIVYDSNNPVWSVTFVASDGITSLGAGGSGVKRTAPANTAFVVIAYLSENGGSGLDSLVKIIKADTAKRIQLEELAGKLDFSKIDNAAIVGPAPFFKQARSMYYERTRFIDGTGVVAASSRYSSGLVPCDPGDFIIYDETYAPYSITFVASNKTTSLGTGGSGVKRTAPANTAYVFVQYSHESFPTVGKGLDSIYKLIKGDDAKRIQFDELGGVSKIDKTIVCKGVGHGSQTETVFSLLYTRCYFELPVLPGARYELTLPEGCSVVKIVRVNNDDSRTLITESSVAFTLPACKKLYVTLKKNSNGTFGFYEVSTLSLGVKISCSVFDYYKLATLQENEIVVDAGKNDFASTVLETMDVSDKAVCGEEAMRLYASADISETSCNDSVSFSASNIARKGIFVVHKASAGSWTKKNDFFLPDVSKNFGDISFEDNNGNKLPFEIVSSGNYDIVKDQRLCASIRVQKNSRGQIFGLKNEKYYASSDNGETWGELSELNSITNKQEVALCANDDSIIFCAGTGQLYRSEYPYSSASMVLDVREQVGHDIILTSYQADKTTSGVIFVGSYQVTREVSKVFRSVDNGENWTTVLSDSTYEHIHRITVDNTQSSPVVYVAMDGYNGLYCSHDLGVTWVDLNADQNIPKEIDHGVIYAEEAFRLLGGETSYYNNAFSLIKTTDDENFVPILGTGKAIYSVVKSGGKYFAATVSEGDYQTTGILVSDDCEHWETAFISAYENSLLSSGGFRGLSVVDAGEIWCYCRNDNKTIGVNSRILVGGNNYCALCIVDIPAGVTGITARNKSRMPNLKKYVLENEENDVFNASLNEGVDVSKFVFGADVRFVANGGKYAESGRHLSDIYPYASMASDKKSLSIGKNSEWFEGELPSGGYTISFWMMGDSNESNVLTLICGDRYRLSCSSYQLKLLDVSNGSTVYENLFSRSMQKNAMCRYDISVNSDGTFSMYVNGFPRARLYSWKMPDFGDKLKFISKESGVDLYVQHFGIKSGTITAAQAVIGYHGNTFDMLNNL